MVADDPGEVVERDRGRRFPVKEAWFLTTAPSNLTGRNLSRYVSPVHPRRHVQVDEGERDARGDLAAERKVVAEALQVDAQRVGEDGHAGILQAIT